VIKRGEQGQALFDANNQSRWLIPAYPVRPVDVTGAGHVYCGGFVAAYGQHNDPIEAALSASAAASIAVEGVGISYPMEAMPGLVEARRNRLTEDLQRA
jgi:2-dehydro-3-deoxygluconokinase